MKHISRIAISTLCAGLLAASGAIQAREYGDQQGMMGSKEQGMETMQQQTQQMQHQTQTTQEFPRTPDLATSYQTNRLIGMKVQNREGQDLGKISELILDENGQITHAVLATGGYLGVGGHKYVVPWNRLDLSRTRDTALVDVPKDQVSSEFSAFEIDEK